MTQLLLETPLAEPYGSHALEPSSAHLVEVAFAGPDGRTRTAIGGGASLREAIAFARASLPADRRWHVVGWDDVHGE